MAEGIADLRIAIAVELILGRALRSCAGGQGALVDRVNVFDIKMNRNRRSFRSLGTDVAHFRILIGEHYGAAADLELGVADAAASRFGKPHGLLRAKHVLVELERLGRVRDAQVRRHHADSLGNWFCCHEYSLLWRSVARGLRTSVRLSCQNFP